MRLPQMAKFLNLRKAPEDVADLTSIAEPLTTHQTGSFARSFGSTTVSNVPTEVFTPPVATADGFAASAPTSLEEDNENSSPDLFPSQDMIELDMDEGFRTSFKESCIPTRADSLLDDLMCNSPFKNTMVTLDHNLTFRYLYELQRVADALCTTIKQLLSDLGRKGVSSTSDYNRFWTTCQVIAKERGHRLPEKSSSSAWESASDTYFENETRKRSVHLAGALTFKSKVDQGLFDFELKPLQLDKSCRFHRKYGPSRFMVLSLPSLSADTPTKYKKEATSGVLAESVARWLATEHKFLGRKWRAFFLEADKKKSKTIMQASGYKVHLFAISGEDPSARNLVEVHQFLKWHIPIDHNLKSTNLKLFQRFSLGLSKTISTFPLDASEFIRLPDPADHAVMNDGCGRMSMTLAKDISRHLGLGEVPSVFQGRVAGAKGLWMVVPDDQFSNISERHYCIEIADSQLKINPHPKDNPTAEEEQRTFEVLKYSARGKEAHLNSQLLTILYDRGVSREVLGDLLVADIGTPYEELARAMRSPVLLLAWLQTHQMRSRDDEEGIRMTGAFPDEFEERSTMLIESGFMPETDPVLRESLRSVLHKSLDRYVERLHIGIPCSTYLYCIADPYGVLEPNEVHLSFSEVWRDPISGFKESFVDGRDILVARLPALLPSDVQRRQAVWKRELHQFKDVVVFSTKGETALAHMLSGGDYDGDTPWICWDVNVVKLFENADMPKMPSKKDCGLVQQSRKIKDVFSAGASRDQLASQVNGFFAGCFAFNLKPSFLGLCTSEHEKVVYADGDLSSLGAIKLAALSSYLVDSAKQGDLLPAAAWQKLRSEVSPICREGPAYKTANREKYKRESNIIDYLKFWRAVPEKERILIQFQKHWPQTSSVRDSILSQPWTLLADLRRTKNLTAELKTVLDHLEADVKQIGDYWAIQERPKDGNWAVGQFRQSVQNVYEQFQKIHPSKICRELSWLGDHERQRLGHWSLVRASCLYSKYFTGMMSWYLAGEELCLIKAHTAPTGYRAVLNSVYPVLKCDSKIAKKLQQRLDGVDLERDTLGFEDIDRMLMMEYDE